MHPKGQIIIGIMGQYIHHINGHINETHATQGNKIIKNEATHHKVKIESA
jgi:hypothetical protein